MSLFSIFKSNKPVETPPDIQTILPSEIYKAAVLELRDVIAPSALKVSPREIALGEKFVR